MLGCGVVVLEVFIPSGGILTFVSAVTLGASLYFAFQQSAKTGFAFISIALVAVPAVVAAAFRILPMTPVGKAFLGELPTAAEVDPDDPRRTLVGRTGVAKTKMLPSGSVEVDGRLIDAVSQGMAIDPGAPIVVVEVSANRVVVRPADPETARKIAAERGDLLAQPLEDFGLEDFEHPPS